eukprot:929374-Pleurochrysis_carterae.AAC.1
MEHATIWPNDGHPILTVCVHHAQQIANQHPRSHGSHLEETHQPSRRPRSRQIRTPLSGQCFSHSHASSGVGLLTATVTLIKPVPAAASSVQPAHLPSALASKPHEAMA